MHACVVSKHGSGHDIENIHVTMVDECHMLTKCRVGYNIKRQQRVDI